jgi:hypothetical protein
MVHFVRILITHSLKFVQTSQNLHLLQVCGRFVSIAKLIQACFSIFSQIKKKIAQALDVLSAAL